MGKQKRRKSSRSRGPGGRRGNAGSGSGPPREPVPQGPAGTPGAAAVPAVAAWIGITLALVNVYPDLFPWQVAHERILGVITCALVAAFAARVSQLAATGRLDARLALIGAAVIVVISLQAVLAVGPH
jgi:hypothetical protein